MKDNGETRIIGIAIVSLLIGAGLGVLFAPQSGRRTRKDIERLGIRTKHMIWNFQESLKDSIDDLIEDIAEVTRESLEKGKQITEEKKKRILEMIDSGERFLSAQKNSLERLLKCND